MPFLKKERSIVSMIIVVSMRSIVWFHFPKKVEREEENITPEQILKFQARESLFIGYRVRQVQGARNAKNWRKCIRNKARDCVLLAYYGWDNWTGDTSYPRGWNLQEFELFALQWSTWFLDQKWWTEGMIFIFIFIFQLWFRSFWSKIAFMNWIQCNQ